MSEFSLQLLFDFGAVKNTALAQLRGHQSLDEITPPNTKRDGTEPTNLGTKRNQVRSTQPPKICCYHTLKGKLGVNEAHYLRACNKITTLHTETLKEVHTPFVTRVRASAREMF